MILALYVIVILLVCGGVAKTSDLLMKHCKQWPEHTDRWGS